MNAPVQRDPPAEAREATASWVRTLLRRGALGLLVLGALAAGYLLGGAGTGSGTHRHDPKGGPAAAKEPYTCSMHPQIRQPGPGKCPICGMDLVPAKSGGAGAATEARELHLDPAARKLAEIETTLVTRGSAAAEVRAVGKVAYDERRVGSLTAYVAGRIEQLHVRFTGARVRRWQPLLSLYSPELLTAQRELLQTARLARRPDRAPLPGLEGAATAALGAARDRLRLLGLSKAQIAGVERSGKALERVTLHAPVGGVVIEKHAQEQMYVQAGTRLFTIADLDKVWVKLQVYESDLLFVRLGQAASFTVDAYPGERFTGTVEQVDPFVTDRTRTVAVRLTVENKDGRLKPDMLVRAILASPVDGSSGLLAKGAAAQQPLLIPATAPLLTGTRAVVYLETARGTYLGQEVRLGPRVGDHYVVLEGLREGDRVVTRGAFRIDSALQIEARPSMMSPPPAGEATPATPGDAPRGEQLPVVERLAAPASFRAALGALVQAYYPLHHGLAHDDLAKAQAAASDLAERVAKMPSRALDSKKARQAWEGLSGPLGEAARAVEASKDLASARRHFEAVSDRIIESVQRFGLGTETPAIRFRCTMAFENRGANWLQAKAGVENPYFGSQMYRCGDQHETLGGTGSGK